MAETVFVGRHDERDRLASVLRGDSGSAGVAVITGDAGMGKSRLLAEVARSVPDVAVLVGSCLPMSEALPYGAITDAFDRLTGPTGGPVLNKALSRCAAFVTPQICALIPAMSAEAHFPPTASADRTRLFAAVRDVLTALGAARRTALVVEDLHWADAGTLDLLTFLVRSVPPGTALVATSRRDELTAGSPVIDWLDTTARFPSVDQVILAPLSEDDVASLVASLVDGEASAAFVAEVGRRGQGNPFFTEQLVAVARDVASPSEQAGGVPAGVAQMLLGRVRSVSAAASDVSAVLAVAARPLGEPELAACVGTGVDVAVGLRDLLDTHLAESAEQDRYRLRHALLEDAVRDTLLASQRAALHAAVAGALAARGGENPGEVAAHWAQAGIKVEEAHWSVRAARHAEGVFAWGKASAAWRRVWALWSALPEGDRPPVRLPEVILSCVGDARRGDEATFVPLAQEALADDGLTSDDRATGALLSLYGSRLSLTDVTAGIEAFEAAVARLDRIQQPSAEQARALYGLARTKTINGVTTGTEEEELARAATLAEQVGAVDVLLELATDRASARFDAGHVAEGLADLTAVLQRAGQGDAGVAEQWAWAAVTDFQLWLLDLQKGVDAGLQAIDRVLALGYRESFGFSIIVWNTVDCLLLRGEVDTARQLVTRYLRPAFTSTSWPVHMSQAELDLLAGDLATALVAVEHLEAAGYQGEETLLWLASVAATADLWSAKPVSAWERTARAWTQVQEAPGRVRASRMLVLAARAAADMADADPSANRDLLVAQLRELAKQAGCFDPHPARVLGAAYGATFEAEIARLQRNEDEPTWRAAKETWAGHGVPHHAAYAGWRLAVCLLDRGRRTDGQHELAAAYAAARDHEPLRREIEALARRARLPVQAAPQMPESSAASTTDGGAHSDLTPRELEVLRLLGTGASNEEIGRRLYISPKTASVHVSHIFRKLGVNGRVQAAMVAERMGLLTTGSNEGQGP